jgi:hypothetical protein
MNDIVENVVGNPVATAEPGGTADDLDKDVAALAVDDGKGNKLVPLSALVGAKRELRTLSKKVQELEPVAARVVDVDGRLQKAQPVIDAILADPKLRAAALKIAGGTHTSTDRTEQPEDDPDAEAFAEDSGYYLADQQTLDVARARRILNRLDARHGRQTDDRIRPLAGLTLSQKAEANIRNAMAETDADGAPVATPESFREVAQMLPANLLANADVVSLVSTLAIGLDHKKGRTPKAPEAPLYLERAGSGGGRRPEVISAEERTALTRVGLTEKQYLESNKRLETTTPGRGVRLE